MNRRSFLRSSVCGAVLIAPPAWAGLRMHGSAFFPIAPGALYNGTAGSGYNGSPPIASVARLDTDHPRPVAAWMQMPFQAFSAATTFGVMARSTGSPVGHVKYYIEGSTFIQNVSSLTTVTRSDTGLPAIEDLFALPLDAAAFISRHATVTGADIYAEVVCVDAVNYDPLILGPFRVVPMAVQAGAFPANDWVKTVSPTGLDKNGVATDYTTIATAVAAAAASGALAPLILCGLTHAYPLTNVTASAARPAWTTVTHMSGVTASLARASAPDYNTASTWPWHPGINRIEFRGPGVVLDYQFFSGLHYDGQGSDTSPSEWFNGCARTNSCASAGSPASPTFNTYWNLSPHPDWRPQNNSGLVGYGGTDDTGAYLGGFGGSTCLLAKRSKQFSTYGNPYGNNSRVVVNCYDFNSDFSYLEQPTNAMTLRATPGAGVTAVTFEKSGASGSAGTIAIKETVGGVATAVLSRVVSATPNGGDAYQLSLFIATVNGFTSPNGTTYTGVTLADFLGLRFLGGDAAIPVTDIRNVTATFTVSVGVHAEWNHVFSGGATEWNYLQYGNTSRAARWGTTSFFNETGTNDNYTFNNVFDSVISTSTNGGLIYRTHTSFGHNFDDTIRLWYQAGGGQGDLTSVYGNNIGRAQELATGTMAGFVTPINNNIYIAGGSADLSSVGVGNTAISQAQYDAMFVDKANGNFLPSVSSAIRSLLVAPIEKYDQNYVARDPVSDWVGPYSKNNPGIPAWPVYP